MKRNYLLIGFFLLSTLLFLRIAVDYDLWWHLAIGKNIWDTRTIPQTDLFSFSIPTYPYAYHSWLTETILYGVYRMIGLWGISFFYAAFSALGLLFILKTLILRGLKLIPATVTLLATIPLFSYIIHARTQSITFFLLCLIIWLWEKIRFNDPHNHKLLWLFPVFTCIWANLHGGFMQGLLLLGLLFLELIIPKIIIKKARIRIEREVFPYFLSLTVATVTTLINPFGFRLHLQAVRMATDPIIAAINQDWAPLFNHEAGATVFAVVLTISLLCVLFLQTSLIKRKIILGILFLLSLHSRRFALPFSVLLIPEAILSLSPIVKVITQQYRQFRFYFIPAYIALLSLTLIIIFRIPIVIIDMSRSYKNEETYTNFQPILPFPIGAVNYMKNNGVPTHLLNDFNWGGYLIWNFPETRFFIDGRMDAFFINGKSFAGTYSNVINKTNDWKTTLAKYYINGVLAPIKPAWPLTNWLKTQPNWLITYQDEISILMVETP
jgi:hypothetical protein